MTTWREARQGEDIEYATRIGGQPAWHGAPRWPGINGQALPFLGQVRLDDALLLIFMSEEPMDDPWMAENGANAVLVEPDGDVPPWVEVAPSAEGPSWQPDTIWVPDAPLTIGGEPDWMQQDETPAAAPRFVCTLYGPDLDNIISFGAGGDAYLFVSADRRAARILWQN